MTEHPGPTPAPRSRADTVDAVVATVLSVPGVAGLHGGSLGEVATYLPGRRVPGVRFAAGQLDVHLSVRYGAPLRPTCDAVRAALATLVGGPVDVTVEDVVEDPGEGSGTGAVGDAPREPVGPA